MASGHAAHAGPRYVPRHTQQCDAVAIVREHLPGFLERVEASGSSLPNFVRRELEAFVTCGDFEQGFLVAKCRWCGDVLRVPFSCKSRGICPSCMGRAMAERAALWVDHRLPTTPWRQWVLTFEGPMATRLGYDADLLKFICQRFASRVMQALRRRVKRQHRLATSRDLHPGVLIVVQRFKNDLGLFCHLHALVSDGCFDHRTDEDVPFLPLRTLESTDLTSVLERLHRDLERRHLDDDPDVDPAIATCVALGRRGPRTVATDDSEPSARPLLVRAFGMQLHAAVTVDGRDRRRLERVARYLYRPAFSHDAVVAMPDGSVRVMFKAPTKAGATFTTMSRDTFLARLCALVPPPGVHMSRAYGVLASKHRLHRIVAPASDDRPPDKQLGLFVPAGNAELPATSGPRLAEQLQDPNPSRIAWSKLLARVFLVDVTVCGRCQGPMRIVEAVTEADDIALHLHGARAPPKPRPPLPGQLEMFGA